MTKFTQKQLDLIISKVKFSKDNLVPAIAQQYDTGKVLMLAYMNAEAIRKTLDLGQVCYYSRSRSSLWLKGETSGNIQMLKSMWFDCDNDTILLQVDQRGPACHTGSLSCFFTEIT